MTDLKPCPISCLNLSVVISPDTLTLVLSILLKPSELAVEIEPVKANAIKKGVNEILSHPTNPFVLQVDISYSSDYQYGRTLKLVLVAHCNDWQKYVHQVQ